MMKAYRKYKTLQGIGSIRIRLGLTQQAFAVELGISRSLLSLVESRSRTLPTAALVKLAAMEAAIAGACNPYAAGKPHPAESQDTGADKYAPAAIQGREMNSRLQAAQQQYRLKQMELNYGQLRQNLQNIEQVIGAGAFLDGHFSTGFLEGQRYNILRKLSNCNLPAQLALRHKIVMLQAAAELGKTG
jgi:transcriptional regulator with XRE-family HTH domain